jgi:hypothetical protein
MEDYKQRAVREAAYFPWERAGWVPDHRLRAGGASEREKVLEGDVLGG